MSGMRRWFSLLAACCLMCVLFLGCGRDDHPADPAASGSIAVIVGPEIQATPWRLEGPDGLVAEGETSRSIVGLADGEYTLTWLALDGWVRPWPASVAHTIDGGDAYVVEGEYRENVPSTVTVTATPGDLGASWTLRGSEGFAAEGTGDRTFEGIDAGHYTIAFEQPAGWLNTGRPVIEDEVFGETLALGAVFVADVDAPAGFQYVPAGEFTMGSPAEEWGHGLDEIEHEVTLTNDVFMSTREITRRQYFNMLVWAFEHDPQLVTLPQAYDTTFVRTAINSPDLDCSGTIEYVGTDTFCVRITGIDTVYPVMDNLDVPEGSEPTLELLSLFNLGLAYTPDGLFEGLSMIEPGGDPITGLTWYAAAAYCDWLSIRDDLPRAYDHSDWSCNGGDPYGAEGYRLPTEAEWERACRAGTATAFTTGRVINPVCDDPNLSAVGWHCTSEVSGTGLLAANAWGLKDLHGNAWEWCQDWYTPYSGDAVTDPVVVVAPFAQTVVAPVGRPVFDTLEVPDEAGDKFLESVRIIRGGDATRFAVICRSANRSGYDPFWGNGMIGFRPVLKVAAAE